ncbi:MAG: endopeptidase La [Clostridia bacterium]|nr:endopeptidase La [Clostridia bacterium]
MATTSNKFQKKNMPIIMLPDAVAFPGCPHQFTVYGAEMIEAIRSARKADRCVFIMLNEKGEPVYDVTTRVGVVATITQMLRHPEEESMHVRVTGEYRAWVTAADNSESYTRVDVIPADDNNDEAEKDPNSTLHAKLFKELLPALNRAEEKPELDMHFVMERRGGGFGGLIDAVAYIYPFPLQTKQKMLNCLSSTERAKLLINAVSIELEQAKLDREIEKKTNKAMDQSQKEYYLREKIRIISEELGDGGTPESDAENYNNRIEELDAEEEVKSVLKRETRKLAKLPYGSQEAAVIRGYLDVCLSIPWGVRTEDNLSVKDAAAVLDRDHYGLEKVKERILELIAVRALVPDIKGQIICLEGPPGVGKTSIARSIAEAMGRKYVRVSLGGVRDEAEIRGHRKTYLGSMPGRIVDAVVRAGSMNPLILLDEIDKLSNDYKGDPTSALLEVLDPEQNRSFTDHFLDIPLDLSGVLFITTANNIGAIPTPLYDRMEIIELPSYTHEEKAMIAKKYLVPKQLERTGLSSKKVKITDTAIARLIEDYTREAGVRNLEREIASLCRKCAKKLVSGEAEKISVSGRNLESYMGKPKYKRDERPKELIPGLANGLAWTSVGGEMLEIEVAVMDGNGKYSVTGQLGDVMQESAKTAMSCIRQRAGQLGIDDSVFNAKDIHIHVPEGAVPKDGPSAGITLATAMVSALTGNPMRGDVAMTGEITLTGRVLAIGGLREKSMAAYRNGIKTVIIPAANERDVEEFSPTVKNAIHFVPVKTIDEVFRIAFAEPPKPTKPRKESKKDEPERDKADPKPEEPEVKDEGEKDEI